MVQHRGNPPWTGWFNLSLERYVGDGCSSNDAAVESTRPKKSPKFQWWKFAKYHKYKRNFLVKQASFAGSVYRRERILRPLKNTRMWIFTAISLGMVIQIWPASKRKIQALWFILEASLRITVKDVLTCRSDPQDVQGSGVNFGGAGNYLDICFSTSWFFGYYRK